MQCGNNLKQIGLGILNHHDTFKYFPTAGTNTSDFWTPPATAVTAGFERYGWAFQILPFIEEDTLHSIAKQAEKDYRPVDQVPALGESLVEVPLSIFTCPSRGPRTCAITTDGTIVALGDYAGVIFDGLGQQWQNDFPYTGLSGQEIKARGWQGIIVKGGHFDGTAYSKWRTISSKQVTDGLSHTIAIMEKAVFVEKYNLADTWNADLSWNEIDGWAHNAHQTTMRSVSGDGGLVYSTTVYGSKAGAGVAGHGPGPQLVNDSAQTATVGTTSYDRSPETYFDWGFGSPHPGGVMAVFADGSVKLISYTIDQEVGGTLYRLCARDDGLTVGGDDL